mmetsp:Transcript_6942/g.9367  ORF Transcript_6942/g.9367 Transcript_6942/m.9367 type:complete len:115 (-) Transcript_6942:155-499(-)
MAANSPRELHVFGHDRDALAVHGAEVGVLKEPDQVRLRGLLQRQYRRALPSVRLARYLQLDLTHQPREWEPPQQQICGALVRSYLLQRSLARSVSPFSPRSLCRRIASIAPASS